MLVPQNKITEFFVNIRATFNEGLTMAPTWYGPMAQREASTTEVNRYFWTEDMGELERWVGPMALESIAARTWDVKNDKWKKGYAVDALHMAMDQYGLYTSNARQLGWNAARWPQTLIKPWVLNGDTKKCYDGQPFFDDSHPINMSKPGMGVQSNLFEGMPFTPSNWNTVATAMKTYRSPAGNFLGIRPTHVACAPDIETTVRQFFNSTIVSTTDGLNVPGGHENIHKGECEVLMIEDLPAGTWMPMDLKKFIKPFIYQVFQDPYFIAQDDPNGYRFFEDGQYAYGVIAVGEGFGTIPWLVSLCRP